MALAHAVSSPLRLSSGLAQYLRGLNAPRTVLWCYAIWYVSVVARYFDPHPALWLSSLGLSAIIGTGLYLSTARAGAVPVAIGRWQVFRLYLMPFCVSSFAALIKDRGFFLVFHPDWQDNALALGACVLFASLVQWLKRAASDSARFATSSPPGALER